jgi:hypothetical protein
MLRLQIVDTGFCAETRITPGVQSGRPSVNRTAMILNEVSGAAPAPVTGMGSSATRGFIKYLKPEVLTTALVESAIVVRTGQ